MGEWSKKIGEVGERIVADLLEEIGWGDAQKKRLYQLCARTETRYREIRQDHTRN